MPADGCTGELNCWLVEVCKGDNVELTDENLAQFYFCAFIIGDKIAELVSEWKIQNHFVSRHAVRMLKRVFFSSCLCQ